MYFARIDILYRVLTVIVASQDHVDKQPGTWVPCDINGLDPKNFPGIGYKFDPDRNAFIPPKPFPSWILNETSCQWEAPLPMPEDVNCVWNESRGAWQINKDNGLEK